MQSKDHEIIALELHVSHQCNLACTYCYANQGDYGGDSILMSRDTAREAIDFLLQQMDCCSAKI